MVAALVRTHAFAFLCPFSALEAQGEDAIKRNHATYRVYEK